MVLGPTTTSEELLLLLLLLLLQTGRLSPGAGSSGRVLGAECWVLAGLAQPAAAAQLAVVS